MGDLIAQLLGDRLPLEKRIEGIIDNTYLSAIEAYFRNRRVE
jgi:hypothetical protein